MKYFILCALAFVIANFNAKSQDLSPFVKVGEPTASIEDITKDVINKLNENSFSVLGTYNPSGNSSLGVIAFTRSDLKNTVIKVKDRGALGAVMKVGLVKKGKKVVITYTNPDYLLRAYMQNNYSLYAGVFTKFSEDLKVVFSSFGNEFSPYGGSVPADELAEYHYKIMMPYFTDPIELNEYASFEEGLEIISKNLNAKIGNTVKVYSLVYKNQKVAVFGVGLRSRDDGESHFLPIIGEDHVAALPYEIILQGNKATMLHGKYRIALHWPELTMGTFMKIMSTPGDIEETLEALCEKTTVN